MSQEEGNQASAPAGETPTTLREGVEQIEALMDPSTDTPEDTTDQTDEEVNDEAEDQPEEESNADEDATDEGSDETEDDTQEPEETQDSEEDEPLDYVEDTVVKLGDSETTLGEIVQSRVDERVKHFQGDYTRKTQEIAEERRLIDKNSEDLNRAISNAQQKQETFLAFQQQFAPESPDLSLVETDPIAYQQQKAYHDEWHNTYQNFANQYQQGLQEQQQMQLQQMQNNVEQNKHMMVETVPELGTETGMKSFKQDLVDVFMPAYGYSEEELGQVVDYRFAAIAKDAMAYRKLQSNKPKTQEKLKGKPPVLKPKAHKRGSKNVKAQEARKQRLDQFGTMQDGIAALMDFDL